MKKINISLLKYVKRKEDKSLHLRTDIYAKFGLKLLNLKKKKKNYKFVISCQLLNKQIVSLQDVAE